MAHQVEVPRGKTVVVSVSLGFDLSKMTFASRILSSTRATATILTFWDVALTTNGKDGELVLTLPGSRTSGITQEVGYMDLIRTSGGTPLYVFRDLEVRFIQGI